VRWSRERYLDLMTFGEASRQMFVELFGPLVGLEEEWRAQGATDDEIALTAFDWDYVPVVGCGGDTGMVGAPDPVVLEETAEHIVSRDGLGRTMKLIKGFASIALPLDFPVKSMDDWLRLKPLFAWSEARIDRAAMAAARASQRDGSLVLGHIPGGFDSPRELMGDEAACLAYYEQPELMHDILSTLSDTSFRVLEAVSRELTVDQLSVHEDLAGKSGPLVGPSQIREFIKPHYRRTWELLRERGTRIFQQDSDGNVNPVIDAFLDCGLTCMFPMEPAAGMDVVEVRKKYGKRLSMQGGIDKHVLRRSKEEIRKELEYKMQPSMRAGGMVFGVDHRIPNGTPIDNYRHYVRTGREILGLEPLDGKRRGWRRMAF
jgi:uroporphyrinogen-III decarboxylase